MKQDIFTKAYLNVINESNNVLPDQICSWCDIDHSVYTITDLVLGDKVSIEDVTSRIKSLYDYVYVWDYILKVAKNQGKLNYYSNDVENNAYEFINNNTFEDEDVELFLEYCTEQKLDTSIQRYMLRYLICYTWNDKNQNYNISVNILDGFFNTVLNTYGYRISPDIADIIQFVFGQSTITENMVKKYWNDIGDEDMLSLIQFTVLNNQNIELSPEFKEELENFNDDPERNSK